MEGDFKTELQQHMRQKIADFLYRPTRIFVFAPQSVSQQDTLPEKRTSWRVSGGYVYPDSILTLHSCIRIYIYSCQT